MDHLNFLFNDYYDINYALGMVLASLLSDQIYHHIFTRQDINLLLQSDGNRTAKEILENVGIDINDSTMISQLLDKIVSF